MVLLKNHAPNIIHSWSWIFSLCSMIPLGIHMQSIISLLLKEKKKKIGPWPINFLPTNSIYLLFFITSWREFSTHFSTLSPLLSISLPTTAMSCWHLSRRIVFMVINNLQVTIGQNAQFSFYSPSQQQEHSWSKHFHKTALPLDFSDHHVSLVPALSLCHSQLSLLLLSSLSNF